MEIVAHQLHFSQLNRAVRETPDELVVIRDCIGQRYIASGLANKKLEIYGTPGNALAAYLDGCTVHVYGNVQEATGDTMNAGEIFIHGSAGDATGYAMRGGRIFIEGDVGYRAGIHMKAYQDRSPVMIVGGRAGSFLGEYLAGGTIAVLGLNGGDEPIVGRFCGTGMHGGKIYLRCDMPPADLPVQVKAEIAGSDQLRELIPELERFCGIFGRELSPILESRFYVLTPNSSSPYRQLYVYN